MLKLAGENANSVLVPVPSARVPVRVAVPVFETVKVRAALVVPTVTLPKARLEGVTLIVGAVAVHAGSATSYRPFPSLSRPSVVPAKFSGKRGGGLHGSLGRLGWEASVM